MMHEPAGRVAAADVVLGVDCESDPTGKAGDVASPRNRKCSIGNIYSYKVKHHYQFFFIRKLFTSAIH